MWIDINNDELLEIIWWEHMREILKKDEEGILLINKPNLAIGQRGKLKVEESCYVLVTCWNLLF
jgi:hypothetical protein